MSTGMPAGIWLNKFGVIIRDYFGNVPYHVGSSLKTKEWRDVDVRLILPDEEFIALFGSIRTSEVDPRFAAITLAFSALGSQMTGLPIDFQIQSESHANEKYGGQMRGALIEVPTCPHPDAAGGLDVSDDRPCVRYVIHDHTDTYADPVPVGAERCVSCEAIVPADGCGRHIAWHEKNGTL